VNWVNKFGLRFIGVANLFVGLQTIQPRKFVYVMMDRHVLDIETCRVV